jgi:hypothetical protein
MQEGLAGSGADSDRSVRGAMRSLYDRLQFLFCKEEGPKRRDVVQLQRL